eukprot:gene19248-biopygen5482
MWGNKYRLERNDYENDKACVGIFLLESCSAPSRNDDTSGKRRIGGDGGGRGCAHGSAAKCNVGSRTRARGHRTSPRRARAMPAPPKPKLPIGRAWPHFTNTVWCGVVWCGVV